MGMEFVGRGKFCEDFNTAFSPGHIADTAQKLAPLPPTADMIDMLDRLGLLVWVRPGELGQYREKLSMAKVNQHILAHVMRTSITHPKGHLPVHLEIHEGAAEAIAVTVTDVHHHVVLTRTGFDGKKH